MDHQATRRQKEEYVSNRMCAAQRKESLCAVPNTRCHNKVNWPNTHCTSSVAPLELEMATCLTSKTPKTRVEDEPEHVQRATSYQHARRQKLVVMTRAFCNPKLLVCGSSVHKRVARLGPLARITRREVGIPSNVGHEWSLLAWESPPSGPG